MYCPECGNDAEEAKFCPECGADLRGLRRTRSAPRAGARSRTAPGSAPSVVRPPAAPRLRPSRRPGTGAGSAGGRRRRGPEDRHARAQHRRHAAAAAPAAAQAQRKSRPEPARTSVGRRLAEAPVPGRHLGRLRRGRRHRHPGRRVRDERGRGFSGAGRHDRDAERRAGQRRHERELQRPGAAGQRPVRPGSGRVPVQGVRPGIRLLRGGGQGVRRGVETAEHRPGGGHRLRHVALLLRADRARSQSGRARAGPVARVPDGLVQQGQLPGGEGAAGGGGRRRQGGRRQPTRTLASPTRRRSRWAPTRRRVSRPRSVWTRCPSRARLGRAREGTWTSSLERATACRRRSSR